VETLRAKTPVFTDESGRRLTVLQWVARGLCACFVLVGTAIAFTLVTHVPLPGLGGIMSPPATDSAPGAAREGTAGGERALDTGLTVGSDPGSGSVAGNARESKARPTDVVTAQAAQAGAGPSEASASTSGQGASGSVETPQTQATATASPASPSTPPSQSNANPHATAKSANSTVRATPHATPKSKNAHATAGKANGQSGTRQTSTGRTK
jgi:hypothetical protein